MKLQGKVAVITGGASGLGRRTAEYFVRDKGAKVALFDLNDEAGVVGLSLPAARELAAIGIRVNSIAPGLFNTPMGLLLNPKVIESMLAQIEFPKRFGDLAEFASLCAYICENAYLNGECIRLDAAMRVHAR